MVRTEPLGPRVTIILELKTLTVCTDAPLWHLLKPRSGTIESEGFTSLETRWLIWAIKDLKFVAFDVVEMLPEFDPTMITANLVAHVGYEFASIMALHKRDGSKYLSQLK